MIKNDRVSFVPPKSSVSYVPVHLQGSFFELDKQQAKAKVVIGTKFGPSYGTGYSFNADASPLKFRSFLTFSIKDDISSPFYLENTFWVSDIVQTSASPESMVFKQSNQFYVQKTTGFGAFMGCTFGVVILLGIAALNAK